MEQYKILKNIPFKSFGDLAAAMHSEDLRRAKGLKQTSAARKANATRRNNK